jgi:hypothetical protein
VSALLLMVVRVLLELVELAERHVAAGNALEDRVARLEAAVAALRRERGPA